MEIHIITAFPNFFSSPLNESILKRSQDKMIATFHVHDLRKWTTDNHNTIDDKPFGGGAGMVLMVEPIFKAVQEIKGKLSGKSTRVILTSAKGTSYTQGHARELSTIDSMIIICGHYEGVDERVAEHIADLEISIGNYVLTGGEIAAMVISDSVVRLLPGVLGNEESLAKESFDEPNYTEGPHYTRPAEFRADNGEIWKVPQVLLSGNHAEIEKYRKGD